MDLYQQKMTYAEFWQKQYDFGRDAQSAESAYTRAIIELDDDRQAQAYEQFVNTENNWTKFMQVVNARQPKMAAANEGYAREAPRSWLAGITAGRTRCALEGGPKADLQAGGWFGSFARVGGPLVDRISF